LGPEPITAAWYVLGMKAPGVKSAEAVYGASSTGGPVLVRPERRAFIASS
jgi:hypothetical protein